MLFHRNDARTEAVVGLVPPGSSRGRKPNAN
jgi:hypothetical protein